MIFTRFLTGELEELLLEFVRSTKADGKPSPVLLGVICDYLEDVGLALDAGWLRKNIFPISQANLSVNPYASPLFEKVVIAWKIPTGEWNSWEIILSARNKLVFQTWHITEVTNGVCR